MSEQERQPERSSRFGLLEAFVLFIIFLFLADTAVQYAIYTSLASKASKEVLRRSAAVIEHETASIRKSTEFLLLQAKNSAAREAVDFFEYRSANAFFMDHMEAHPHITSVNYGDSAGNGYLILFESGVWRNRIKKSGNEGIVTWVFIDNNGKVLSQENRKDDYDPRVRPWYADAAGSQGIHWSRPYIFRTTHDVGITASLAIGSGKYGSPGVIGADVMLKHLSRFLSGLKSGNADLSINMVSQRGEILASSEVDNFLRILGKGSSEIPRISDDGFQDLSAAFRVFERGGDDFLSYASSGKSFYALRRPFSFTRDQQFFLVLTVPQQSLLSFFGSANKIRALLFLAMIAASGLFFAIRYLSPLRKLTRAMRTFGTDGYKPPSPGNRKDEVGLLVSEFCGMADKLSAKQRDLTSLINNVPGIIYRGNRDGSISFIGSEIEPVTGYPPDAFTSGALGWKEIVHPDDLEQVKESFRKAEMEKSETLRVEYRIRNKDGGNRWIADRRQHFYDAEGKLSFVDGLLIDITDQKRSEEARTRLGMAVDQAAEAIIIMDTEGRIEYVNPSFERITGYPKKETVGQNMRILKSGKQDEIFYRNMWETILRGEVWSGRLINRKKDGTLYEAESIISPVRNDSGKIINFVAGIRDITRDILLQEQFQTAQRMESVGTLAGGIAHDFNNTLTGIVGFGELLRVKMSGDEQALHDLDEILHCAERAATLTRQLLTFARRQVIEPVNLNVNSLIADLMKFIGKVVGEHIELKTSLGKDVPTIFADGGQIEQVVMNLCLNARDAMPEGGRLVVETGDVYLKEEDVLQHPYMRTGRYALLTVSDTGIGMDEKTSQRAFEPFFTTKGPDKGTGLGLAMVYGIVKQHDGFIHLYSEPRKGSAFKVYFPAIEAQPDAVPEKRREEIVRGGTETILLAEDEEAIRTLAERILTGYGYTVLVARNGEEAIEKFRQNKEIDLAVLDVVMPRKGGKEAFDEMHHQNPLLKVIFMSGYSADAIHDSFVLTAGMPFLQKPFGPTILARKVREILDTR
jgi:PAS domain S-box-containing protein